MIEDLWYKNAVIYALNVDSFMDRNGDGSDKAGKFRVAVESFGCRWFRVAGLGYALRPQRDSGAGVK